MVAALYATSAFTTWRAEAADGVDRLGIFLSGLVLLPVVAIAVGVGLAMVLRLPLGWLVGLLGPVLGMALSLLLDVERVVFMVVVVGVFAGLSTAGAALGTAARPPRAPSGPAPAMLRPRLVAVVGLADAVLLVAALGVAGTISSREPDEAVVKADLPASPAAAALPRRLGDREHAQARPRPGYATPTGPWSADLIGRGDHMELRVPGMVVAGIRHTSIRFPSAADAGRGSAGDELILPDGSRWVPDGPSRLEGPQDLPFTEAVARKDSLTVVTSVQALARSARDGVTAVGAFIRSDGHRVDRLVLPPGTKQVRDCLRILPSESCDKTTRSPMQVQVTPVAGMRIQVAGDGEASVAGTARVTAVERSWEGMVAAVEAKQLRAAAIHSDGVWAVNAEAGRARQVWMDGWPVIGTELSAKAVMESSERKGRLPLRIRWKNVGHATSQILEAEGQGAGAPSVAFGLEPPRSHDAGLGVIRSIEVRNLRRGLSIPSRLDVGKGVERGLSFEPGADASIVLRGNFPSVTVPLPIRPR